METKTQKIIYITYHLGKEKKYAYRFYPIAFHPPGNAQN